MGALGTIGAALIAASQTPADQAASNLSSYPKAFGLDRLAAFLGPHVADRWGMLVGILLIVIAVAGFAWHWFKKRKRANPLKSAPNFDQSVLDNPHQRYWLGMADAIDVFCDPEIVRQRNDCDATVQDAYVRGHEIENEMRAIRNAVPGGSWEGREDALREYNELYGRMERYNNTWHTAQTSLSDTWGVLGKDILGKLVSGELVAQGFAEPYKGGAGEVSIKASEWRILTIDPNASTAVRKDDPAKIVYSGVQIASDKSPSANGVRALPHRDNLHIRTQEALERRQIEAVKAADFAAWDRRSGLSLREAAYLWSGEKPADKDDDMSQMTRIILGELVSAANGDRLKAAPSSYPQIMAAMAEAVSKFSGTEMAKHDRNSTVTREDLRSYATGRNERPLFLFPEDR